MPRIELITPVYYGPNDPIHWEVDNVPLRAIIQRQELINFAVDYALQQIRESAGNQGSISNRLNQSMEADGSLKSSAVDDTLHSIEAHTDTANYVRMTRAQSDKLDLIADEATNLKLYVGLDGSGEVEFSSGALKIYPSDSIATQIDAPNTLKFNVKFPTNSIHRHYYGLEPVHANQVTPDFKNYLVTSTATKFIDGSLRVYINGVRIFEDEEVYTPGYQIDDPWKLLKFTPDPNNGSFSLSQPLTPNDVIRIDFDVALV